MEIQVGSTPGRHARNLSLEETVSIFAIDFKPGDTGYRWSLQDHHKRPLNLPLAWSGPLETQWDMLVNSLLEVAIHKIQRLRRTPPASFARRITRIIIGERLEVLDDRLAATHFEAKYKLPIRVTTADNPKIVARAHWALGYRDRDNNRCWKLVVLGTRDWNNTLSELLFCLGAIQNQGDQPVFGIVTDAIGFMFVALHGRKVFVSGIVNWFEENDLVVYFFDYILRDIIESCSMMDNTQSAVEDDEVL